MALDLKTGRQAGAGVGRGGGGYFASSFAPFEANWPATSFDDRIGEVSTNGLTSSGGGLVKRLVAYSCVPVPIKELSR